MYKSVSISNIMIIGTNLNSKGGGHYFIPRELNIIHRYIELILL